MNVKSVRDYPEFLAQIKLENPSNPHILAEHQKQLTMLSREVMLSNIDIVFSDLFHNRGVKGGRYRLVDILKTLGAGVNAKSAIEIDVFESVFESNNGEDDLVQFAPDTTATDPLGLDNLIDEGIDELEFEFCEHDPFEYSVDDALGQATTALFNMLKMEGAKSSSVYIVSQKGSAFLNGYYLLYPFVQVIYEAICAYIISTRPDYPDIDIERLAQQPNSYIEVQHYKAINNYTRKSISR